MRRIVARDTEPELLLRHTLWRLGIRYRIHVKTPAGRADFANNRQRWAVFVDGCFWHGCPEHYVMPRSRKDFWSNKLSQNVARDARQTSVLLSQGWVVIRFWEHDVRSDTAGCAQAIANAIRERQSAVTTDMRVCEVRPHTGERDTERRVLTRLSDVGFREEQIRVRTTHKIGMRSVILPS